MENSEVTLRILGDTTSLNNAVNSSTQLLDQFGNVLRRTTSTANRTGDSTSALQREFHRMRMGFDPLYRATSRYNQQIARLNTMLSQGAISADRHGASTATLTNNYNLATRQTGDLNQGLRASRFHTANLGAQFNDIGVMLAAGQSPLMLAIQQGTQISQVFNSMDGTVTDNLSALWEGIKAMISPMSLLTIGTIAGGAALLYWGIEAYNSGQKAFETADAVEELSRIIADLTPAVDILESSLADLGDTYGLAAGKTREYAQSLLELQLVQAKDDLMKMVLSLKEVGAGFAVADRSTGNSARKLRAIRNEFGLAEDAALEFGEAIYDVRNATTELESTNAVNAMMQVMEKLNISAEQLPSELREAMIGMIQVTIKSQELANFMERAAAAAANMTFGNPLALVGMTGQQLLPPPVKPVKPPGTGQGKADTTQADLERLKASLLTELEAQMENFQAQEELLALSLQRKYIVQTEHDELMQKAQEEHNAKLAQLDVYAFGNRAQQMSSFMGEMAGALAGGNEKMFRISKAFGAGQALINAWGAYTEALNTKEDVSVEKRLILAAAVLSAGFGAVSAIKGVNSNGSGGGGASNAGAGATAATAAASSPQQVSEIRFMGNLGANGQQIIDLINSEYDRGNYVRAVVG
jgi:hypothetical protein